MKSSRNWNFKVNSPIKPVISMIEIRLNLLLKYYLPTYLFIKNLKPNYFAKYYPYDFKGEFIITSESLYN